MTRYLELKRRPKGLVFWSDSLVNARLWVTVLSREFGFHFSIRGSAPWGVFHEDDYAVDDVRAWLAQHVSSQRRD